MFVFFFKQKTAYEMRISDWSSDVCSSDLYIAIVRSILAMLDDQYELAVIAAVETDSNDRWELAAFTQYRARDGCSPSFFLDETALDFIPGSRMVERKEATFPLTMGLTAEYGSSPVEFEITLGHSSFTL